MTGSTLAEAVAHHAAGRLADAVRIYQAILARSPADADAMAGLGVAALDGGKPEIARPLLAEAARRKPDDALIHNNLANAAKAAGDAPAALASYRRAVALVPSRAELVANLAAGLAGSGARAWGRRAVDLAPADADAWFVLAQGAAGDGRLGTAVGALARSLVLDPARSPAWFNRANALRDLGEVEAAVLCYRRAVALDPADDGAASNLLFALCFVADRRVIARANRDWGRRVEAASRPAAPFLNARDSERRLTIGYLSPDFRRHQSLQYVTPLLDNHDRERFRLVALADVPVPDEETRRLRAGFDEWHDISRLDDSGVDRIVRTAGVDVLVCLTGYVAAWRRRFVPRKAPVQVAAINQVSPMGLKAFDARLTDRWLEPPELGDDGPEQPIRLASGYAVFQAPERAPELTPPPRLRAGHVTFASFNNLTKLTDASLGLFARVLEANPGSRLLVKAMALSDDEPRSRFVSRLRAAGLDPDRIDLIGRIQGVEANLAVLAQADIAFDPIPFNGGMSTMDALWMGVPVVSLKGPSLVGRVGASMLSRAGLAELVAETSEGYVRIATALAGDPERLATLRSTMRDRLRQSLVTNGRVFAWDVEQTYRDLWRRWCRS